MRHLLSIAITAFFATMMFLLGRDHVLPGLEYGDSTTVSGAQLADQWVDTDEWNALTFNGTPIGTMRQAVERRGTGFVASMKTVVRSGFVTAELETAASLNERMELQTISMRLSAGERSVDLDGAFRGRDLYMRLHSATGTKYTHLVLREVPTLNASADALFAGRMMSPGDSYLLDVYDPVWGGQAGKMRISMVGEETIDTDKGPVQARMAEAVMQKIRMRVWLDDLGKPLRREYSYIAQNRRDGGPAGPTFSLRMDRLPETARRDPKYADLIALPEPPTLAVADLQGENTGEPLQTFGFLPMLLRSQMKNFQPDAEAPTTETP